MHVEGFFEKNSFKRTRTSGIFRKSAPIISTQLSIKFVQPVKAELNYSECDLNFSSIRNNYDSVSPHDPAISPRLQFTSITNLPITKHTSNLGCRETRHKHQHTKQKLYTCPHEICVTRTISADKPTRFSHESALITYADVRRRFFRKSAETARVSRLPTSLRATGYTTTRVVVCREHR